METTLTPVNFKEATKTLTPPKGMEENCGNLHTHHTGSESISKWRIPFLQRIALLFTGHIWLGIHSAHSQPPVWMDTANPFHKK